MRREMISGVRRPEYDPERCTYAKNALVRFSAKGKYADTVTLSREEMSTVLTAIEIALKVETNGTLTGASRVAADKLRDVLCKLDI